MADIVTHEAERGPFCRRLSLSAARERDDLERKSVDRSIQRSMSPKFLVHKKLSMPSGPRSFKPLSIQIEKKKLSGIWLNRQPTFGGNFKEQIKHFQGFHLVKSATKDYKGFDNQRTLKLSQQDRLSHNLQTEGTALKKELEKSSSNLLNLRAGLKTLHKELAQNGPLRSLEVTFIGNLAQVNKGKLVHEPHKSILKNKSEMFGSLGDRRPHNSSSPKGQGKRVRISHQADICVRTCSSQAKAQKELAHAIESE